MIYIMHCINLPTKDFRPGMFFNNSKAIKQFIFVNNFVYRNIARVKYISLHQDVSVNGSYVL